MAKRFQKLKDHWREQRLFFSRVIAAAVVVVLLTGVLVARLVHLQVIEYQRFSDLSQDNRLRIEPLAPTRGLIFDRNGLIIAENLPTWQLVAIPEQIGDLDAALAELEELGLVEASEHAVLADLVRSHRGFERVKLRNLNETQAARFAVRRHRFPGIDIQEGLVRYYPFGEASAHAVGYVGSISTRDLERIDRRAYAATSHIGKTGIERSYEDLLHGQVGYRQQVVNAQGRILLDPASADAQASASWELETKWPVPGDNVVLSLDMRLQLATHEALAGARGAAIAIDPANGDVLALVSTPSFDPNRLAGGLSRSDFATLNADLDMPMFNRALAGQYPPGSTVKPFFGLAALQLESSLAHEDISCPGFFTLPGHSHRYRDWRPQGHGPVDLRGAIVQSCDVYFYRLAVDLGIDRLEQTMKAFGFGAPTGLDIMGERAGVVPSREWKREYFPQPEDKVWFPGETVITGIGQGFTLVTPLQLAHATAVLAARGASYQPRLLIGTEDAVSRDVDWAEPAPLGAVEASEEHWAAIHDAMVGVTKDLRGSGRTSMLGTSYVVAGKTGTAQVFTVAQEEKYDADEVDERLRDHGLFIAFAPAEAPRIAVAVVIENGGGGSSAAAPVARKILDAYFAEGVEAAAAEAGTAAIGRRAAGISAPSFGALAAALGPAEPQGEATHVPR
ncbi:MAG: penicillin-binding protein 2 [Gammaproteobacteria bacterium]|nr:penicillin-binding protein 2 [Gammaproteobacteria bacterium]